MEQFNCDWGTRTYLVTAVVLVILTGISIYMLWKRKRKLVPVFIIVLLWMFPITILFRWMPTNIFVDDTNLIIKGIARNIAVIALENITSIERYEQTETTIRKLGSGGCFGDLGEFENKQLGIFQMYVTNEKNMVLIKTKTETYVVSCENPDLLIQHIIN